MARLNIEDSLWADPRFQDLMIKTGSRHAAKGMMVELWVMAQKYWIASGGLGIPKPAWDEAGMPAALLECKLAKDNGDFIYAAGSKEQFAWLDQKSESGKAGGKASGKSRRETKGKSAKQKKAAPSEVNRLEPSYSSSSSSSFSSSFSDSSSFTENKEKSEIANPKAAIEGESAREFIAIYCERWKDRYGTNPEMGGAPSGIAKRLVKNLGLRRAVEVVQAYFDMNDSWFVQKRHDLFTLERDLGAVVIFADTGKSVTQGELRAADRTQTNKNVWASLKGKGIRPDGQ